MKKSRTKLLLMAGMLLGLAGLVQAQQSTDFFNNTSAWSGAAEICHVIPASSAVALAFYGVHVTNTSGSTLYAAIFPNTVAKPSNGTVIPGGGWAINATSDRDINAVIGAVPMGGTNMGFTVCLSTTQGTFTAATAVGWFWALYRGQPSPTPTPTPTPT